MAGTIILLLVITFDTLVIITLLTYNFHKLEKKINELLDSKK